MLTDAVPRPAAVSAGSVRQASGAIAERVTKTWELGPGLGKHVTVEMALGTREGSSVRGGALGGLHEGGPTPPPWTRPSTPRLVAAVAARRVLRSRCPRPAGGGVVDSAALDEFAAKVTGRDGVLASAARMVLGRLGIDAPVSAPAIPTLTVDLDLPPDRLGRAWVAPVFDFRKAVFRRPLGQRPIWSALWLADEADHRRRLGSAVITLGARPRGGHQADWWRGRALREGRGVHASLFARIAAAGRARPPAARRRGRRRHRCVEGLHRRSRGRPVARRRCDRHRHRPRAWTTIGWRSTESLYRDHARYGALLCGFRPTWPPPPTSMRW